HSHMTHSLHAALPIFGLNLHAEPFGRKVGGKGPDLHVEIADGFDVTVPGHGDAVLGPFQLGLQVAEVGVGLDVRIGLGDHHEAADRKSTRLNSSHVKN